MGRVCLDQLSDRYMIPLAVPYVNLRPETRAALGGEDVLYRDVSGDNSDYFWLIEGFWHRQQGLILVEQDIVPPPGAIATLRGCDRPWCGVPYLVGVNFDCFNGCTKYDADLMARYPDAVDRMENTHWQSLDGQLIRYLWSKGEHAHIHWPAARHLNACGDETRVLANCECGGPLRFADLKAGPGETLCPRCGKHTNHFAKG